MIVKIAAAAMASAAILIPAFSVYADQGAVVSVNGKISAPESENSDYAENRQSFEVLKPDKFFAFKSLAEDTHYGVSLFVASSIEFDLGEDTKSNAYWRIVGYDHNICQLSIRHVKEGILDLKGDRARFRLTALKPGYTRVVLARNGKKFTVHLSVR